MYLKTFALLVLVFASLTAFSQEIERYNLNTGWTMLDPVSKKTFSATIPGSVQTELMQARVIPDPFVGTNESKVLWVAEQDWSYISDPFQVESKGGRVELTFNAIDTYSNIYLNDELILETNNYFREYKVDVTHLIGPENTLRIDLRSPLKEVEGQLAKRKFVLPGEQLRAVTRKPQFHYGWDWGPKIVPMGVDKPIAINIAHGEQIKDVRITYPYVGEDEADIHAEVDIIADKYVPVEVLFFFNGGSRTSKVEGTGKPQTVTFDWTVKDPELWWTHDLGDPHLYEVGVTLFANSEPCDSWDDKVGIREIKLVREADNGESFGFSLNGKPVFAKGANYIPQDIFQHRVKQDDYQNLLQQCVDANMNMLRVWGGGIYEEDIFYDLCDEKGILVWQDFMFACAMYPGDKEYLANVEHEAVQQVTRLRNHPCIALWCGNNENSEGWHRWGWQTDLSMGQRRKVWKDYKRVFMKLLPKIVEEHSTTDYWESSPMLGRGDPEHQFRGDAHYWGVWHDAEPFEVLNDKVPRFMSEFGFQSFPDVRLWESISDGEPLSLESEVVLAHEKHPRGFHLIGEYMERWYGKVPDDFEDYVYLSQILQAEGMALGLEAHRRSQPWCMGTLYWQLNDCWPVASWSSLDSELNWKALHYKARDAFAPLLLSMENDSSKVSIHAVIEKLDGPTPLTFEYEILDFSGDVVDGGRKEVTIEPGSNLIWQIPMSELCSDLNTTDLLLRCRLFREPLRSGGGQRTFTVDIPKNLALEKPSFSVLSKYTDGKYEVEVTCKSFAKNVILKSDLPGHFSDNFFDLIPGDKKKIIFTPDGNGKVTFGVESLWGLLQD